MNNKVLTLLLLLALTFTVSCSPNLEEDELVVQQREEEIRRDITDSLNTVNQAESILLKKEPFTFSNINFKVYADNEYVGRVKGKIFNMTGDRVVFYSKNGNILGYEEQMKRWGIKFNRMARIFNYDDTISGFIGERVFKDAFKLRYSMHFFDQNKKELGHSKKKIFSFFNNNNVYNNNNELSYEIKGRFSLFKKYEIKKIANSEMTNVDMIYFTVIQDAINKAGRKK